MARCRIVIERNPNAPCIVILTSFCCGNWKGESYAEDVKVHLGIGPRESESIDCFIDILSELDVHCNIQSKGYTF
jgi:hypothetical protein